MRPPARSVAAVWGWPVALGVLSLVGLVIGLADDDLGDVLAWLMLGLVTAVCLRFAPGMPPENDAALPVGSNEFDPTGLPALFG